ncbi:sialin [Dendroctonus ponderosae]|uniref:Major facilitator superfamily (MFS) profile domain-containing protein n=1 Tax=Dendroctonus ponderosae TaxID=77166 RepID=A0AAR5QI73_DENPD|nr:sialin [Dendroctonus ponderosae]XP_019772896.1 sialin [Dendroctonus ponderosae]XP_019772897.1 sialin [Dendroctonus ponderosae]XP_048525079.1 sialin [Dendroctonus ponderosae]XP_048525080.1 sialin [Dendroctonus ponderosae]
MGLEDQEIVEEVKECCKARDVLWYLVFVGFAVNYMIRINLNIAIVAMIQAKPKDNISLTSECLAIEQTFNATQRWDSSFPMNNLRLTTERISSFARENWSTEFAATEPFSSITFTALKHPLSENPNEAKFAWNEKIQGYVLGSFFWLHWTTQIPGGLLASKYGTKMIFGLSNFAGVLLCFLIPYFAKLGSTELMALRLIQGILCGFAWPSMHDMTARWIPPNERSKFVTSYLGSSVGAAITYPICGFIIHKWGWEYVFYASSAFGTVWFIAWWSLVHDSPSQHPRISEHEKNYILKSLGQSVAKKRAPVPWAQIFRNRTVWMNILAQWGGLWGLFTLMTQAPTYFKFIHGWNIRATGVLSGLPHMLRMLFAYIFSQIGDYLMSTNKMSRTNVRKLATAICCIGQGMFMLALAYSGCNSMMAIISLTLAVGMHGSVSTGPLASVVDISPNYAAVLLGLLNTAGAIGGFLTPAVVGYLTYQNQTTTQWQKVFWISTLWLFFTGILYVIFAKSEIQPWNSPEKKKQPEEEMMVLKSQKDIEENNKHKVIV